jgi:hypothetical protein
LCVDVPKVASEPVSEPTSPMRMMFSGARGGGGIPGGRCPGSVGVPPDGPSPPSGFVFFSQPEAKTANDARTARQNDRRNGHLRKVRVF